MFDRILIAVDGSKNSKQAAKAGIELARLSGGSVIIVYVADVSKCVSSAGLAPPFGGISADVIDDIAANLKDTGEKVTIEVDALAKASGVEAERLVVDGNPPSEILLIAEDKKMDLIVIGSIGKTGIEKFLMGSVAEKVVHNSKLPVLVVR